MQQPGPLHRLGRGGVSVAWAVRRGPEDRDAAPAALRHCHPREGAGTCGCRVGTSSASDTWASFHWPFLHPQYLLPAEKKREMKTEVKRKERGERGRSSPLKESATPHGQGVYVCFPVTELNSAFWPYPLEGRRGDFVQPLHPPARFLRSSQNSGET